MKSLNTTNYSNRELLTLILIGITGSAAVSILPFIINAFSFAPELDVAQASSIASIELLALTVVSISYRFWRHWGTYKQQVVVGIALYCLGNFAIMLSSADFIGLSVWRAVAGFGAGTASAVAFAAIARQRNPDGIFAILIFFQVLWSAAGSFFMPLIMELFDWTMAFAYMLIFGLVALLYAIFYIPDLTAEYDPASTDVYSATWIRKAVILAASIIWYIALGLFWGNSAQTGTTIGVSPIVLGAIFSFGYLVSLSGNGIALWLSRYYSRQLPLIISGLLHGAVYWMFSSSEANANIPTYLIAVLLFSLTWAVFTPFQIGMFSELQSDGAFATTFLPSSITGILIGTAIGPFLGEEAKLWLALGSIITCLIIYQAHYHTKLIPAVTKPC